jgi:isopenicillin N synthase-like dioxygenase
LTSQKDLRNSMAKLTKEAFGWSDEVKQSISKHRSPHYLGFTGIGGETTNNGIDQREVGATQALVPNHTKRLQ